MVLPSTARRIIPAMFRDSEFMMLALKASERGAGFTEPNPMVGAVVVKNGRVLAVGHHAACGKSHAERVALEKIPEKGTTIYVTLEPCCHVGKTPPCTDVIIAKKVARVVVAMKDPNPLVSGKGIALLRRNGIDVRIGCEKDLAARLNRHYLKSMVSGFPYIAIRAGISLDGKMSDKSRRSRWITSPELRERSRSLRGEFSAILAGSTTVLADDPQLTLRDPHWDGKRFFRVVLETDNRLPNHLRLFQDQDRFPTIVFSSASARDQTPKTGLHFFIPTTAGGLPLPDVCRILFRMGIISILVEGGEMVIDSFLKQELFDEVILFVSPTLIGGRDSASIFSSGADRLEDALRLKNMETIVLPSGVIFRGFH